MTMNKKEFIEYVQANIKSYLPDYIKDGCQIELIEVTKNNDITLTGLNFNRGEGVPSPNFYFEPAYEAYCDGHTIEELLENLAECAVNSWSFELPIDIEKVTYADIKDNLTYQVVDVFLPSSIHEVMIVPAEGENVSRLAEIIRDANETVVAPDEFLSNRLFSYDHKGKNLVEHVVPLARTIDDMER